MNLRILELIKNPENLQNQDLDLLNLEIRKHPYLQNIRALHLYGTHQFNNQKYKEELSITAAYTTDKKILYQFINKKNDRSSEAIPENVAEKEKEPIKKEEMAKNIFTEIAPVTVEPVKPVVVDGVINRILFEGEEDFLERDTEKIDMESTLESGKLVTHKPDKQEISSESELTVIEKVSDSDTGDNPDFSTEKIIDESEIEKEEQEIKSAEVSFHGVDEFLPNVSLKPKISHTKKYEVPKSKLSRSEIEMQKLIAEVEAKVKATKKEDRIVEEPLPNKEVNFSETQSFEISPAKSLAIKKEIEADSSTAKNEISTTNNEFSSKSEEKGAKPNKIKEITENSAWKPMSFSNNNPDSFIGKTEKVEEVFNSTSKNPSELPEDRPAIDVSFFPENVSALKTEIIEERLETPIKSENKEESNIPNFINTWQNWLKIERTEPKKEEKPVISKIEVKKAVIENFIEKEPKISKLKEESDFVIKEKGTNISHLMTETLANLYVEQKLYAKAIKGYEILQQKHPAKGPYFAEKIKEIKELRKNS